MTPAVGLSHRATASAFSLCFVMRSGSVSRPWMKSQELNGERAAPKSRSPWMRALRMNASGPNAAV